MARVPKLYSASEILQVLQKQWLTTDDIQILSGRSIDKARELKKEIARKIVEEDNYLLPNGLVPSDKTVKYLNLNINYLKKMAKTNE